MPIWAVIGKAIIYTTVAVCYLVFKGPELAFAMYIPVDLLLEFILLVYRKVEQFIEKKKQDREKERKEAKAALDKDPSTIHSSQLMKAA